MDKNYVLTRDTVGPLYKGHTWDIKLGLFVKRLVGCFRRLFSIVIISTP